MALTPCLRCSEPLGEDQAVCPACGQKRDEAVPASPEPAPPPRARGSGGAAGAVALVILSLAGYGAWYRYGARGAAAPGAVPAARTRDLAFEARKTGAPAAGIPAAPAPTSRPAPAPAREESPADDAPHPEDREAELPSPPRDLDPAEVALYGVVYDLATKKPVGGAKLSFANGVRAIEVTTDAHGWYRANLPITRLDAMEVTASVSERRHRAYSLQERDPPLASRSPVERRTIAEEADPAQERLMFRVGGDARLAELDLAMIPMIWPKDMPPPRFADAVDPPVPFAPNQGTCRFYGVVYDLATKKPVRRLTLEFVNGFGGRLGLISTDGLGRYLLDANFANVRTGITVTGNAPDARPGLIPERDPAMRLLSARQRRDIADSIDLAFDPVPMPNDCDDGLIRQDFLTVPQHWPR